MITTVECRTISDDLLDLVPVDAPGAGDPSPRQRELMVKLTKELRELDVILGDQALDYMLKMVGHWTPGRDGNASRWIDRLIAKIKELKATRPATELEDGMYLLDGEIYKVQYAVHGSGKPYAKRLVPPATEGERARFDYAPGMVRKLRPEHRMSLEQAREYGELYGVCVRCGAVLTKEKSIERAMGDTCAGKI